MDHELPLRATIGAPGLSERLEREREKDEEHDDVLTTRWEEKRDLGLILNERFWVLPIEIPKYPSIRFSLIY